MAATAQYLEKAYDKLFKWCSLEFRNLGRDAVLEVSNNLREGVKRLRQRPELLGYDCSLSNDSSSFINKYIIIENA